MNIFFTSDTHFGYSKVKIPKERPWENSEEMDNILINNWNNVVKNEDLVYHLGDFSKIQDFEVVKYYLSKLNGNIILISGNHDSKFSEETKNLFFKYFQHQYELYISKKELYVLNHCPMFEWNKSHHNSFHLFGHCHGVIDNVGKTWDVGVDNNNFTPISLEEIRLIMQKRPNNRNYIETKYLIGDDSIKIIY